MAKAIIEHEFETENETARRELKVHDKRCLQSPEWEQVYEHAVTYILGGCDLGTHADLILQGILFAQFTNYWSQYYKSDSLFLKLFVLGLCLATTFKSAHAMYALHFLLLLLTKVANRWIRSALVWVQNVEYFMDIKQAATMFFTSWLTQSTTLIGEIIAFSVQLYRDLVTQTVGHYHEPTDKFGPQSHDVPGPIHYGTVVTGDVILSGTTIYFLLKRSREAEGEVAGALNERMRIVFQSAVPVTLCALANFITAESSTQSTSSVTLFLQLTNMMLPKLYAMSAMWTLNARKELSSRFGTDAKSSSDESTSGHMETKMPLGRLDGGPTVRIESQGTENMFEGRINQIRMISTDPRYNWSLY
ncbi:hypothetical protein C8J57DRAFT_1223358 [Mycena rebaudengoi]|nr:hypothetical protein C8J57DRAFT_1223358 [Mycena rebaudengoi]